MAIEDIFRALEEQGETEIRESVEAAREQARGIEEDATAEGERVKAAKLEAARTHVEARRSRTINAANLDARRQLAAVKEAAIGGAFDAALEMMNGLRESSGYADLFAALAAEALDGQSGEVVLQVHPADESLARAALGASGLPGSVETSLDSRGGLTVLVANGAVIRRNTVEDRLEKYRSAGESRVAEVLTA